MSADADRKFFDLFMVVLAALVGISVLIWVISDRISDGTQKQYLAETPEYQAEIADRIAPVGSVRLPGEAAAAEAAVQAVPEPVAAELTGAQVYNANCGACHTNGIGGAPKIGDGDAWVARAAQGLEMLRDHAVNGFQGEAGYMPAK
ncbi:MAG: c-type cytochrome, partial [Pseudomonadota bacterium]